MALGDHVKLSTNDKNKGKESLSTSSSIFRITPSLPEPETEPNDANEPETEAKQIVSLDPAVITTRSRTTKGNKK